MNAGKILKVRLGHDANCSSLTYLGGVIVSYSAYLALVLTLVIIRVILRKTGLAAKLGRRKTLMLVWVIPQALALVALLVWAIWSGAMMYASFLCVGVLALVIIAVTIVGYFRDMAGESDSSSSQDGKSE